MAIARVGGEVPEHLLVIIREAFCAANVGRVLGDGRRDSRERLPDTLALRQLHLRCLQLLLVLRASLLRPVADVKRGR